MNEQKLDIFERLETFHRQLEQLGIPADKIGEIADLLGSYTELQEQIRDWRRIQFLEDARELLYRVNSTNKNERVEEAARFLREFAECVVTQISSGQGMAKGSPRDLTDFLVGLTEVMKVHERPEEQER